MKQHCRRCNQLHHATPDRVCYACFSDYTQFCWSTRKGFPSLPLDLTKFDEWAKQHPRRTLIPLPKHIALDLSALDLSI